MMEKAGWNCGKIKSWTGPTWVCGRKGKGRKKKREMERTRSRLVKMSGWNEVRRVDEMISNGSGLNIYDRRRENDRSE